MDIPFADTYQVRHPDTGALKAWLLPLNNQQIAAHPDDCDIHPAGWCGQCDTAHEVSLLRFHQSTEHRIPLAEALDLVEAEVQRTVYREWDNAGYSGWDSAAAAVDAGRRARAAMEERYEATRATGQPDSRADGHQAGADFLITGDSADPASDRCVCDAPGGALRWGR